MQKTSFVKKIVSIFKPFRKPFFAIVFILFIGQGLVALSPYLFGKGVDAVTRGDFRLTFIFIAVTFALSIFDSIILTWIKEIIELRKLEWHVGKVLSLISIRKMFGFSIGQHINEHSGVKQTIVNKGQNSLFQMVNNFLYNMLPVVIQIIVTSVILIIFDWKVGLVASLFAFFYVFISYKRNMRFFPQADEVRKKHQVQSKIQSELFRNSTLVISEAQEEKTAFDFEVFYSSVNDFSTKIWSNYMNLYYFHKVILVIGKYVTLTIGVYLILTGKHSVGMFVALYAWIFSIFNKLENVMGAQRRMLEQIAEIKKFFDLLDKSSDVDINESGKVIQDLKGSIEFKDVSFAYPYRKSLKEQEDEEEVEKEQEHTVSNISFKIPAGSKVGFVGVSGSGKSTIINLIRRFYDATSGEILIDDVPLKELNLSWFRSNLGNVEQRIELFDRSIKDNILFSLNESEVSEEKLKKAIKDASLEEFVLGLKDHGIDTVIGEEGIKVSGGERQRIGIARALIKNPKILIFDEATSSLDSINEKLIHESINRSAEGRTTIIVAHRLSTVMDADIIFVVAGGKIVDSGTHKELEKQSEEYQKLIKNQVLLS